MQPFLIFYHYSLNHWEIQIFFNNFLFMLNKNENSIHRHYLHFVSLECNKDKLNVTYFPFIRKVCSTFSYFSLNKIIRNAKCNFYLTWWMTTTSNEIICVVWNKKANCLLSREFLFVTFGKFCVFMENQLMLPKEKLLLIKCLYDWRRWRNLKFEETL